MVNMKFTKNHLVLLILAMIIVILMLPLVYAEGIAGPGEVFTKIFEIIIQFFGFEWLKGMGENAQVAFVRFLIFIVIARLLYGVLSKALSGKLDNTTIVIVSIILSLMGSIGIPKAIMITIITLYSTIATLAMLGGVVYIIYLAFQKFPPTSKTNIAVRILILVGFLSLLSFIGYAIAVG
ncbi:MAG: hypothetical protein ABIG89_01105 [Candidatus Woesearchaeota archaeon]